MHSGHLICGLPSRQLYCQIFHVASVRMAYFLFQCSDLPGAAQVIQKRVTQGQEGHFQSRIPIINCPLISSNDSFGK